MEHVSQTAARFMIFVRPSSYCPLKVQGSGSRVGGQFFEVDFFDILAAVPSEFYDSRLSIRNACDIAVNKEVHADVAAEGDGVTGKEELGLIRNEEPSPDTIRFRRWHYSKCSVGGCRRVLLKMRVPLFILWAYITNASEFSSAPAPMNGVPEKE